MLEAETPGASAAEVCRRHDIVTSMLFRWRVQLGFGAKDAMNLVAVRVIGMPGDRGAGELVLHDLLQAPDGMAIVDLPNGRRVFAPAGADPDAVRRQVAEREAAR